MNEHWYQIWGYMQHLKVYFQSTQLDITWALFLFNWYVCTCLLPSAHIMNLYVHSHVLLSANKQRSWQHALTYFCVYVINKIFAMHFSCNTVIVQIKIPLIYVHELIAKINWSERRKIVIITDNFTVNSYVINCIS